MGHQMQRRDEKIMYDLISQVATDNDLIRAVIMNGSRASPNAKKDIFQDYDIVYLVTDVEPFVVDKKWISQFGDILIMQEPDLIDNNWPQNKNKYVYLMLFNDGNRIDLTLFNSNQIVTMHKDSQSILLLDKDNVIGKFNESSDRDYLPNPPSKKEFLDCCNEFFWVSTYVAKGLYRKELTYTKTTAHMIGEGLLKLLAWYASMRTNYKYPIGKFGRYLEDYLEPELWQKLKASYSDADYEHMWNALFDTCDLFNDIALKVSEHFNYDYKQNQYYEPVLTYLHKIKKLCE